MNDINDIANTVSKLYTTPAVVNFKAVLSKGVKHKNGPNSSNKTKQSVELNNLTYVYLDETVSYISGKDSLDTILKKTLRCNILPEKKLTLNGVAQLELKKGIEILKNYINILIANKNYEEMEKKQKELAILEKKYVECLEKGDFEYTTDYKKIALQAFTILSKNDDQSRELYASICKKMGCNIDAKKHDKNMSKYLYQDKNNGQNYNTQNYSAQYKNSLNSEKKKDVNKYVPSYKVETIENKTDNNKNINFPELTCDTQPTKNQNTFWNSQALKEKIWKEKFDNKETQDKNLERELQSLETKLQLLETKSQTQTIKKNDKYSDDEWTCD